MDNYEKIKINTEFIKLQQFLKLANIVGQGSDAKILIAEGLIKVNGEIATQRGKKLYAGDKVEYSEGGKFEVIGE